MPANPWELRADVRPLEVAAARWSEIGTLMARRGDEIIDAARRATEGWDAAAAESYERHRRQVLANVDRFTHLAGQVAGSLRAISAIILASQKELDLAWSTVAIVPHDVVGESRQLVFRPSADDERGMVTRAQAQAEEIRSRLALSLDQESARLRAARAELVSVRTELTTLAGGTFARGLTLGEQESGVGTVAPASTSTSVLGSPQSGVAGSVGVAGLPPIAATSVSMPHLTGISSAALASFVATAAGGLAGRRATSRTTSTPPVGGMAAGAVGARAGSTSRGMASGRSGPARTPTPRLEGEDGAKSAKGKDAARQSEQQAEKDAAREAKRAALEEKRAARAARRAARESDHEREPSDSLEAAEDETPCDEASAETETSEAVAVTVYEMSEEESAEGRAADASAQRETGAEGEAPRR